MLMYTSFYKAYAIRLKLKNTDNLADNMTEQVIKKGQKLNSCPFNLCEKSVS